MLLHFAVTNIPTDSFPENHLTGVKPCDILTVVSKLRTTFTVFRTANHPHVSLGAFENNFFSPHAAGPDPRCQGRPHHKKE